MARYLNVIPMVDSQENSFARIGQYLATQKFSYVEREGEMVFQKGKGTWMAPRFLKVTYSGGFARVEAWMEGYGAEQDLSGTNGVVVKNGLQKVILGVEQILRTPGADFVPEAPGSCRSCGAALLQGAISCTQCGQLIPEAQPHKPYNPMPVGEVVSKSQFRRKYAGDIQNREIRNLSILGYFLVAINVVLAVLWYPFILVDMAIFLGLLLGMHLGKSKLCAIGLTAYAVFCTIINLINTGEFTGYLWIIIGINALVVFRNTDKRYKELTKNT